MLVKSTATRWRRDVGISELIEYLDQPKFVIETPHGPIGQFQNLSKSDRDLVSLEMGKCQDSFEYAAKNYFWITNKDAKDQLFTLWESQELVLEIMKSMRDKGMAQRIICLKARQVGLSTLCEGLIAWRTMFFPNINAVVVGPDLKRSKTLFAIMLHIYDQMPWWLKPMCSNRTYDGGLTFENPNPQFRRTDPGLKSMVEINMALQFTGIAQGIRVTAAHCSEISDWPEKIAVDAIEGDLGNALADSPMTFAMIESTAQGAGTYYEDLWLNNKRAGDDGEWRTVFIPAFMEHSRRRLVSPGWTPKKAETQSREMIQDKWTQCDNKDCLRWFESVHMGVLVRGEKCLQCKIGTLRPYILDDEQLRFMEWRRLSAQEKGVEALKKLRQELAVTDLEAFQLSGDPVFPEDVLEFATRCVRNPIAWGKLDSKGKFHGVKREVKNELGQAYKAECWQDWCTADHRFDDWELRIWEFPMEGHTYIMGVDVAEGLGGKHDYSVISIIRLGKQANADVQVAVWRSNTVNHYELAIKVVHLGSWYNTAQACVEYNIYQTCGDAVRIQYNYPNLHRWKHLDHQQINSTSWHWITNGNTKPKLWGDMVRRLRAQLFWPRSDNLIEEMKRFQKSDEDSDKKAEAERGCFVAGSKVITKGFIPVPIEKIKPGDEVLTVSGTFEKVIRTTCRAYSGDLHEVSVTGVPRTIECTSEHPFFAKKRNGGQTLISAVENNEPEWIEAKHLRQGDLCCIPQAVTHRMELPDDESLYALGFYSAEGNLTKEGRHIPSFGKLKGLQITNADPVFFDRVRAGFEKMFPGGSFTSSDRLRKIENSKRIYTGLYASNKAAEWMKESCGEYSHGKHFPIAWMQAEGLLPMLAGWADGDGSFRKDHQADLNIYTVSEAMAYQGAFLFRAYGKWCTLHALDKRVESHRDYHIINIKARNLLDMPCIKDYRKHAYRKQKIQVHQRDQKFYTPINWIKKKPVRDLPVFNLEVAGDHTYTIEGVGVHNSHDDELMATFIASYCAHETDYDATLGYNVIRGTRDETAQRIWHITCLRCAYEFDDDELPNGRNLRCEQCSCILLKARKNGESVTSVAKIDLIKMEEASTGPETPDYDSL